MNLASLIRFAFKLFSTSITLSILVANFARAEDPIRIRDVIYGRKAGMALTMDVMKPAKPNGIGVIAVMSGGFTSDHAMIEAAAKSDAVKTFSERGDVVFLVCHGSQPKFFVPEIVTDMQRSVRFIRSHAAEYGVDSNRLGITGSSSGGYLCLAVAVTGSAGNPAAADPVDRASSSVQAVACFFPPTDLVDYGMPGRSFLEYQPVSFAWNTVGLSDKPKPEQIEALRALSPINRVTTNTPPTFILHGDADPLVPHEQSVRFMEKLEENHVAHRIEIRKGAGHGWASLEKDYVLLADWFDKYLAKPTQ